MMGFLRLIASTKTTVFFLLLLALALCVIAFANALPFAKTILLHDGLSSLPILVLLDLLLLNQFAAAIVRFRQYRLRKNDPFYTHPDDEEDEIDEDWGVITPKKKKGEPLPFPAPLSERSGTIDTLLPADNAQALLKTLSFRMQNAGDADGDGTTEKIVGRQGSGTAGYTFALHIGAIALLSGWFMLLAIAPGHQTQVYLSNKPQTIKANAETPLTKLLKKVGMAKALKPKASVSPFQVSLSAITPKHFKPNRFHLRSGNKIKVAETAVEQLFLKPKKLQLFAPRLAHPSAYEAELTVGLGKEKRKRLQLNVGESETHQGHHFSLSRPSLRVELQHDGKTLKGASNKAIKVAGVSLKIVGIARVLPKEKPGKKTKGTKPTAIQPQKKKTCTLIAIRQAAPTAPKAKTKAKAGPKAAPKAKTKAKAKAKASKNLRVLCVGVGGTFKVGGAAVTLKSAILGATLRIQRSEGVLVLWVGLLLFIFGFIGFWWPTRYELQLLWRRGNNDITIKGTGLGIAPKELLDGIAKTLYFPTEWLGGPAKRPQRPAPSTPPVPTPPQQMAPKQAPQRPAPRPTQTAQRQQPQQPPAQQSAQKAQLAAQAAAQQKAQQQRQAAAQQRAQQAAPQHPVSQQRQQATAQQPKPPAPKQAAQARPPAPQQARQAAPPQTRQQAANASILPPTQAPAKPAAQRQAPPKPPTQAPAAPKATPPAPQQRAQAPKPPAPKPAKRTQTSDALPAINQGKAQADTSSRMVQQKSSLMRTDAFDQSEVQRALQGAKPPMPKSQPPVPKVTGGQPTLRTVQPETLLPKTKTAKTQAAPAPTQEKGLDLDSLFEGLESGKPTADTEINNDLSLDIDSLFDDFEGNLTKPKKS